MRRLLPALIAAMFAAVSFSAYAADEPTPPTVQQTANPMDQSGQGGPQSSGIGAVEEGAVAIERGDPTGTAAPGGDVTSPTPTGPGRGDNQ